LDGCDYAVYQYAWCRTAPSPNFGAIVVKTLKVPLCWARSARPVTCDLKEGVAEQTLELHLLKKSMLGGAGRPGMKYGSGQQVRW